MDQLSLLDCGTAQEPEEETTTPIKEDWRAKVPTVSELNRRIRGLIENTFFDVWVKGEISNFRKPISGHAYFAIKDANSQMKAVMFKGQSSKLKFQLKDGMEVLLHGTVSVYEARGEYQLVCDTAEPVGVGALQLAFNQLKEKLEKEGLFDKGHKLPLPSLPQRIGIITSPTGAAVKDILKVLHRRFYNLDTLIIPASVQGDKAAPEIVAAIKTAEKWNTDNPNRKIEVLIIGRGGGSLEDLWPFNEETVARAIYACTIPTISSVGHEIDFTIADFVADLRAPTPSAAAEMVIPKKEDLQNKVEHQLTFLKSLIKKQVEQTRLHLMHLSSRLLNPKERILKMKEAFKVLTNKLETLLQNSLQLRRQRIESLMQILHGLSPLQVVQRGYSLTQNKKGKIIRSINELKLNEEFVTVLSDGEIRAQVLSLKPKES